MKKPNPTLATAVLPLVLIIAALWWSGCNNQCSDNECGFTSTTIEALDTTYYPYVRDFADSGKIYTYEITVDGRTFIRSYQMTEFEHKVDTEIDYYNHEDCYIAYPCDSTINRWYEMKCVEVNGNDFAVFKTSSESTMRFQFYDIRAFSRNDMDAYGLDENFEKQDTIKKDINIFFKWFESLKFFQNNYNDVTSVTKTNSGGDTLWHKVYNKNNGIIHFLDHNEYQNYEIKLLEIK